MSVTLSLTSVAWPASHSVSQSVHQSANQSVKQSPTTTIIQSHAPRNATSLYVSLTPTRTSNCLSLRWQPFQSHPTHDVIAHPLTHAARHMHSIHRLAVSSLRGSLLLTSRAACTWSVWAGSTLLRSPNARQEQLKDSLTDLQFMF